MRCPLCLKELTADDELERFCTEHPDNRERFNYALTEIKKIYCFGGSCSHNKSVGIPGVFLRHVGCQSHNPFWGKDKNNTERVLFPEGSGDDSSFTTTIGQNAQNVTIDHWEIALLRMVPSEAPEMWFPLMLLRAMTETIEGQANGKPKRIGALVEIAGARNVGKTVLAIQAMDQKGYQMYQPGLERLEVSEYVCPPPRLEGIASDNPFLETLYLLNRMRTNEMVGGVADVDVPSPTKPSKEPGDLKVAFIKPSNKSIAESENDKKGQSQIRQILNDVRSALRQMRSSPASDSPPFWYTIAFYDTAGEIQKRQYSALRSKIEKAVDKVAILVDALEVVGGDSKADGSIQVAVQRIRQVKDREDLEWCLVVTQIDRIQGDLAVASRTKLANMLWSPNNSDRDYQSARDLLISLLDQNKDQNKENLKDLLLDASPPPIFFLGTENLPDGNERYSQHPKTFGLTKFICWCLNSEFADINQRQSVAL